MASNDLPDVPVVPDQRTNIPSGDFDFPSPEALAYYASIEPPKGVVIQSLKDILNS